MSSDRDCPLHVLARPETWECGSLHLEIPLVTSPDSACNVSYISRLVSCQGRSAMPRSSSRCNRCTQVGKHCLDNAQWVIPGASSLVVASPTIVWARGEGNCLGKVLIRLTNAPLCHTGAVGQPGAQYSLMGGSGSVWSPGVGWVRLGGPRS